MCMEQFILITMSVSVVDHGFTASKGDDWHKPYTITVTICDQDDYDIGQIYYCREENFTQVLRELINWMNDLEYGLCFYDEFIEDVPGFFPDCGCRKEWR